MELKPTTEWPPQFPTDPESLLVGVYILDGKGRPGLRVRAYGRYATLAAALEVARSLVMESDEVWKIEGVDDASTVWHLDEIDVPPGATVEQVTATHRRQSEDRHLADDATAKLQSLQSLGV